MARRVEVIAQIDAHAVLVRDTATGIAQVRDGWHGQGHSAHPNIHWSGSVRGMKKRGYWERTDRTARAHGQIYNIDRCVVDTQDSYAMLAREACRCGGNHDAGHGDLRPLPSAHETGGGGS